MDYWTAIKIACQDVDYDNEPRYIVLRRGRYYSIPATYRRENDKVILYVGR